MLITSNVSIKVPVGGETVTFVCRRPSAQVMSAFLKNRFETKGKRVKSNLYEARATLIDKILFDIEGAEYESADGQSVPLNRNTVLTDADKQKWQGILGIPVNDWKDLIPLSWKSSAAMSFEDAQPDDEADPGN